jgi:hypothetical protein
LRTYLTDLTGEGRPALVVATASTGKDAYGAVRILQCGEKGLRALPSPKAGARLLEGYRGRDQWGLEGRSLVRTFPVHLPGDDPEAPTGGLRTVRFDWEKGRWRVRYRTDPPKTPDKVP